MILRGRFQWTGLALLLACGLLARSSGVSAEDRSSQAPVRAAAATQGVPIPVDALPKVRSLDISQGPVLAPPANSPAGERVALEPTPARRGAGNAANGEGPRRDVPTPAEPKPEPKTDPKTVTRPTDEGSKSSGETFSPKWRSPSLAIEEAFGLAPSKSSESASPSVPLMPELTPPQGKSPTKQASPPPFEASDDIRPLEIEKRQAPVEKKPAQKSDEGAQSPTTLQTPPTPPAVATPLRPLTRNEILLRNKIRRVLAHYSRKPLNSAQHDTWEVMHWVLAYGLDSQILQGGPRGEPITAIGWLCYNRPCKNKQLLRVNEEGEVRALYGVGLQGHMGQFLAMLAQSNVDRNYPIVVDGKNFTILDLIAAEQKTCYANTELTFKLISLMHYLPSDATWLNDRGETWNIERLIEEELKQPIRGAACGGTHRLAGLSLAVSKRQSRGEPVTGVWARAAEFTENHEQYAFRMQNSDGSFSTQWFRGPGRERDIDRRIKTSGHILEWLVYQSTDEELDSSRMVRGVNYVTNLLYNNSGHQWEIGPHCHALHALQLYNRRKFAPYDNAAQVADRAEPNRNTRQSAPPSAATRPGPTRGR